MSIRSRLRDVIRSSRPEERALAYLNESTSIVDLERREREVDAGLFRRNRFPY